MISDETILAFFNWCETTWLGETVRASLWLFPVIESFHLVALAALGGAVILVDLRLLGVIFKDQPKHAIVKQMRPLFIYSLTVIVISGILLFLSEAIKCYYNDPFWIKMKALGFALVFAVTVRRWITKEDGVNVGPWLEKAVGLASLSLWGAVAWGGRWIGFWG